MIQLGAPGVYIVEAPSGLRPITAVATSIAAFVDFFPEGPTDQARSEEHTSELQSQ